MLRERHFEPSSRELQGLNITIQGETRIPRYTEAIELSPEVFSQARKIGKEISAVAREIPTLIQDPDLRRETGMSDRVYYDHYEPFIKAPHSIVYFGVDAVIDTCDNVKIIEINTRPQCIGRFDAVTPGVIGQEDANASIAKPIKKVLSTKMLDDTIGVVISHPNNAFHSRHKLFAEQIGYQVASLQDLATDSEGDVILNGQRVGVMFRQFNTRNLVDPNITDPKVLKAMQNGKVTLDNGPLIDAIADKTLLPLLPKLGADIAEYLPDMKVIRTGDPVDLKGYSGWWLKGVTRGPVEFVTQLNEQTIKGWRGEYTRAVVSGDLERAESTLIGKDNSTAKRLGNHLTDMQKSLPGAWLLQKNVAPKKLSIEGCEMYSVLRMYYVVDPTSNVLPEVRLEILAGQNSRVSAAGYTIPVTYKGQSNVSVH